MSYTSPDNWVYEMECGHEYDSSFRRSEGAIVTCSVHGPVRLTDGDFLGPYTDHDTGFGGQDITWERE